MYETLVCKTFKGAFTVLYAGVQKINLDYLTLDWNRKKSTVLGGSKKTVNPNQL